MRVKADGLPARLDQAKRAKGLTIEQVAEKAGLSTSGLNKWFAGKAAPRSNNLVKVANALGVNPNWLLSGDGPMEAMLTRVQAREPARQDVALKLEGSSVTKMENGAPATKSEGAGESPEMDEAEERFLFALADNIERIYKELGATQSREQLRALVVQQYRAICATTTAEERRSQRAILVTLVGRQLRRDILKERGDWSQAEPG